VHVLQNTKITVQRSGSLQKFYHGKVRLAVKFENNNDQVMLICDRMHNALVLGNLREYLGK